MTTKEILIEARKLIDTYEKFWQKGDGRGHTANRNCMITALVEVSDRPLNYNESPEFEILKSVAGVDDLGRYNDTHTHAEILDVFDRAIQEAQ